MFVAQTITDWLTIGLTGLGLLIIGIGAYFNMRSQVLASRKDIHSLFTSLQEHNLRLDKLERSRR